MTDATPMVDDQNTPDPVENVEPADQEQPVDPPTEETTTPADDSFPREYVEELREENKRYRLKAKSAEELQTRLHEALVRLDGRLADPTDLKFSEDYLNNPDALADAITDLVARKPGLKAQQFSGDVGMGKRGSAQKPPADLISIIRGL